MRSATRSGSLDAPEDIPSMTTSPGDLAGQTALRPAVFGLRGILKALATVTAALAIGVLATGGTYALWNKSAAIATATITAGTAGLAVTTPLSMPATVIYPGITIYGTFAVKNTGDVSMLLNVKSLALPPTALGSALTVSAGVVSTTGACATGVSLPWSGTAASVAAVNLSSTALAAGASATVCVGLAVLSSAPVSAAGQTAAFTLGVNGIQP
jgi:hypothetical protein